MELFFFLHFKGIVKTQERAEQQLLDEIESEKYDML